MQTIGDIIAAAALAVPIVALRHILRRWRYERRIDRAIREQNDQ